MKKISLFFGILTLVTGAVLMTACGASEPVGKTVATAQVRDDLVATLATETGALKKGEQEFTLAFADKAGKGVDVGSVALNFQMPAMGSMSEMNSGATFTTTGTPGMYRGKADIEMVGDWKAQVTFQGPQGNGSFSIPVVAK